MAPNITEGFAYMQDTFVRTNMFNVEWVIPALILFMMLVMLSSKPKWWKVLGLPMTVALHAGGLKPHFLQYIITSLFFTIEVLTTELIGKAFKALNIKKTAVEEATLKEAERLQIEQAKQTVGQLNQAGLANLLKRGRRKVKFDTALFTDKRKQPARQVRRPSIQEKIALMSSDRMGKARIMVDGKPEIISGLPTGVAAPPKLSKKEMKKFMKSLKVSKDKHGRLSPVTKSNMITREGQRTIATARALKRKKQGLLPPGRKVALRKAEAYETLTGKPFLARRTKTEQRKFKKALKKMADKGPRRRKDIPKQKAVGKKRVNFQRPKSSFAFEAFGGLSPRYVFNPKRIKVQTSAGALPKKRKPRSPRTNKMRKIVEESRRVLQGKKHKSTRTVTPKPPWARKTKPKKKKKKRNT